MSPALDDKTLNAVLAALKGRQIEALLALMESMKWNLEAFDYEVARCGGMQRFLHIYASLEDLSPEGCAAADRIRDFLSRLDQRLEIAPALMLHATGVTRERVAARMREVGMADWISDHGAFIATIRELVGLDAFTRATAWVLEQFMTSGRA